MDALKKFTSRTVVLPFTNIDTDQIIPARFLRTTGRAGLGKQLFHDWRYDSAGAPRAEFALNRPEAANCGILVAGRNFGCGSSREHAPWALLDYGFRAVISTSIADIFRANALKNGLLPVIVDRATHQLLLGSPGMRVSIDLEERTLAFGDARVAFDLDPFSRPSLPQGVDELGFLLAQEPAIAAWEGKGDGCAR